MPNKLKTILPEAISTFLILLFVYTGVSKLITNTDFQITLADFPLLHGISKFISFVIPISELSIVGLLFYQKTRGAGLLFAFILLILFTAYIGYAIKFEMKLPCSCGGILKQMTWRSHLVFNIILSILSFASYVLFIKKNRFIAVNRLSRKPV